jgi:hypothetical protein
VAEAVHRVHPEDDRDVQPGVLDGVALDGVVLLRPALPVLSLGLSVPPARIDPVRSVISTFSRQTGCSGSLLPPLQSPLAGGLAAFSLPMTIWSI